MIVRLGGEKRTNVMALIVSTRDATADTRRPAQPVVDTIRASVTLWGERGPQQWLPLRREARPLAVEEAK